MTTKVHQPRNRQARSITQARNKLESIVSNCNASTSIRILDNETLFELNNAMRNKHITYQIVPPYSHRANLAERSI